ncbi:probable G-protein coupled receptor 160 [Cottoperca gobio]|uniref:Probable G-protein coupled receptor 160 n=1 Tax=Cottoperca gobio TaxID=56716 RepID=A0A6J2PZK4_COTGO|nr:probable G-protein coupled receptor 160 [Cottoperca gobio]
MLAVIKQRDMVSGRLTDNIDSFLLLMLFKFGLDVGVLFLCSQKQKTSFFSLCSLSIILADFVTVFLIAIMLFLGPETYLELICFLLANASAIYGALPLPMMCLGLLDYCLEDTYLGKQSSFRKFLRNAVSTLLVWILAAIYSFSYVDFDLKVQDSETGIKALVCEVEESKLTTFLLGIFSALILVLLPYWSKIPKWVKQSERLFEARKEPENQTSDLLFMSTNCLEKKSIEQNYLEETTYPPPLWLSLTLGFAIFWMPYLALSVACQFLGFAIPSYISVNLLWLECTNSLLLGVVFWVKSNTQGPYSQLPENVCMWHIYWHLNKGTQQQQLPVAVLNPSDKKIHILLCVQ